MIVLVCGGRNYSNQGAIFRELSRIHDNTPINAVVQGGASGADKLGKQWASLIGAQVITFDANWDFHGRAAGPIRNANMLKFMNIDLVVACPGGRGTASMVQKAEQAAIPVIFVGT